MVRATSIEIYKELGLVLGTHYAPYMLAVIVIPIIITIVTIAILQGGEGHWWSDCSFS